jgi:flagellar hook assembly protein FlgD
VTGYSWGTGTSSDYTTIKYVKKTSDVEDETGTRERPSEFDLSQNYPNPFNPSTKIEFTLSKSGFVTLQIYDILGRKVRTLVSEHLSSGYKSVIWDGKNDDGKDIASGVYFYQLRVGDFSEPKKMVLLK